MKRLVLTLMLLAAPAAAQTTETQLAINWVEQPKAKTETVNARAELPQGMTLTFVRDVGGGVSTDSFALHFPGGSLCSVMVRSTDAFFISCGNVNSSLYGLGRDEGSPLILKLFEPEPPAPPAKPKEKRKVPPPIPQAKVRA